MWGARPAIEGQQTACDHLARPPQRQQLAFWGTSDVAFGFERQRGTARGYVNIDNPDFSPGARLSRRAYDNYVEGIGKRNPLLAEGVTALQDAEELLQAIEQEYGTDEPEAFGTFQRITRQRAGQRRYNAALQLYVEREQKAGRKVNKKAAAASSDFKRIMRDIKGKPNKSRNPNVAAENRRKRSQAFADLGGSVAFVEQYRAKYGNRAPVRISLKRVQRNRSFWPRHRGK